MLKTVGLLVDLVPGIAERLNQIGFQKAVMADDFQGRAPSGFGQGDTLVLLVQDQRGCGGGEALDHAGDGGGSNIQTLGKIIRAGRNAAFAQIINLLQVILNGLGKNFLHKIPLLDPKTGNPQNQHACKDAGEDDKRHGMPGHILLDKLADLENDLEDRACSDPKE